MAVAPRPLTLEEFLKLPEEKPALEFSDGVVTQKVSPKGRHSRLHGVLVQLLSESAGHPASAWVLPELRATFAGASIVPDISVYQRARVPRDARGRIADDFLEPPDIAIEIVSPGQSATTLVRRCLWYVAHGVQIALLVDPSDESVLAFRPGQPAVAWHGADRIDLHEVVPGFELTVERLFASLEET